MTAYLCTDEPWWVKHRVLGFTVFCRLGTYLMNNLKAKNKRRITTINWTQLWRGKVILLWMYQLVKLWTFSPWATAQSAPCSEGLKRWPLLPLEWSSVCALSSSAASPCRPQSSPTGSHPAEVPALWSSYNTKREGSNTNSNLKADYGLFFKSVNKTYKIDKSFYLALEWFLFFLNKSMKHESSFLQRILKLQKTCKSRNEMISINPWVVSYCDEFKSVLF